MMERSIKQTHPEGTWLELEVTLDASRDCAVQLLTALEWAAEAHADHLGIGRAQMLERYAAVWMIARVWFLLETPLDVRKPLTVRTWSRGVTGAVCYRDFDLFQAGQLVGEAVEAWTVVELEKRKLLNMRQIPELRRLQPPERCKSKKLSHMAPPEALQPLGAVTVCQKDIDRNGHLNNANYLAYGRSMLPPEFSKRVIQELRVDYSRECFAGDTLRYQGAVDESRIWLQGIGRQNLPSHELELRFFEP